MAEGIDGLDPPDVWNASWEANAREQLVLGLAASPAERLAWLEEMIYFAHRAGALPRGHTGD